MNTGEKLIRKGEEKGRQEGLEQGMRQGVREAVASILRARFGAIPENAQARIKTADLETLQRWLDRAIVVRSLDETFDDEPGLSGI